MIRYLLSILFRLFKRPVILSMHEEVLSKGEQLCAYYRNCEGIE